MTETKYCQSCIERGVKPPNIAMREWEKDYFLCEECFTPLLQNLSGIAPASITTTLEKVESGPILNQIYNLLEVPSELRFDRIDTVQKNHEKIFNFHAPAIVNKTLEEAQFDIEQWGSGLFHIQYKIETLQSLVSRLKEERRKEKNLSGVSESRETYSKPVKSKVLQSKKEKLANTLGLDNKEMEALIKSAREREFNKIIGHCELCGNPKHESKECPPKITNLTTQSQPTQIVNSNVVKMDDAKRKELLEKAKSKLNK